MFSAQPQILDLGRILGFEPEHASPGFHWFSSHLIFPSVISSVLSGVFIYSVRGTWTRIVPSAWGMVVGSHLFRCPKRPPLSLQMLPISVSWTELLGSAPSQPSPHCPSSGRAPLSEWQHCAFICIRQIRTPSWLLSHSSPPVDHQVMVRSSHDLLPPFYTYPSLFSTFLLESCI